MNDLREQMLAYVQNWKRAAPILERLRDAEIRQASTPHSIEMFDGNFRAALNGREPDPSSGLVIQQQLFRKLHPS